MTYSLRNTPTLTDFCFNASTVRDAKKFDYDEYEVNHGLSSELTIQYRSAYVTPILSPQRVAQKAIFLYFNKLQIQSNTV